MALKRYYPFLASMLVLSLALTYCTFEEEPEYPAGITNKELPVFSFSEIILVMNDSIHIRAGLNTLGNLAIQKHGWVWSNDPDPTHANKTKEFGPLITDTFETVLTGLVLGDIFYLRPFVITVADTVYGPESCYYSGVVDFGINTSTDIFQGAIVQFTNKSVGATDFYWSFGDGDTSTLASPVHTFNGLGDVTVRLTAGKGNCTNTKEIILNITPDPFQDYWVAIPGGTFLMGCTPEQGTDCTNYEYPVHTVTLSPYFIGKTEVTQGQWRAVSNNDPSYYSQCGLDCPVEFVSWSQLVNEFIPALYKKTGKMHYLPTEAEWEYAARGGKDADDMTKYAGSDNLNDVGWYGENILFGSTHPVAIKNPNGYGLFDMSGNVLEFCRDKFEPDELPYYPSAPQTNPLRDTGGRRIMRGGSFTSAPGDCRVTSRHWETPTTRLPTVGFRLVRH